MAWTKIKNLEPNPKKYITKFKRLTKLENIALS